jgi:D-3-phosphoglycerate dehydrogenase
LNKPFILNTSRGGVIHTAALIEALKLNKIRGAALDVLENEDISSHTNEEKEQFLFLKAHPHILVTPHIAGYSHEAFYKMSRVLLDKLDLELPQA